MISMLRPVKPKRGSLHLGVSWPSSSHECSRRRAEIAPAAVPDFLPTGLTPQPKNWLAPGRAAIERHTVLMSRNRLFKICADADI